VVLHDLVNGVILDRRQLLVVADHDHGCASRRQGSASSILALLASSRITMS